MLRALISNEGQRFLDQSKRESDVAIVEVSRRNRAELRRHWRQKSGAECGAV